MINNIKNKRFLKYSEKYFLKIIGYLIFGLALFYIFEQIKNNWEMLENGSSYFNIKFFILYLISLQIYFFYQINLWKLILKSLGTNINFLTSCYFYYSNNLLAYTPGKIANALGMASVANKYKISISNTITTLFLFQIYSLISGTFLISLFSLSSNKKIIESLNLNNLWILFIASLLGLTFIYPSFRDFTIINFKKITGKKIKNPNISFRNSIFQIILYAIGWLINCLSITFLIKALTFNNEVILYPLVVLIFIASYLTGLLAFVVPAGFGILEAGFIYGFGMIFTIKEIILITIILRLGNVFSTLFGWSITKLIVAKKAKF